MVFNGENKCLKLVKNAECRTQDRVACLLMGFASHVLTLRTAPKLIGIEKDEKYFEIAKERIAEAEMRKNFRSSKSKIT